MRDERFPPLPGVSDAIVHSNGTVSLGLSSVSDDRAAIERLVERVGAMLLDEPACTPRPDFATPFPSHLSSGDGSAYACVDRGQVYIRGTAGPADPVSLPPRLGNARDEIAADMESRGNVRGSAEIIPFPTSRIVR